MNCTVAFELVSTEWRRELGKCGPVKVVFDAATTNSRTFRPRWRKLGMSVCVDLNEITFFKSRSKVKVIRQVNFHFRSTFGQRGLCALAKAVHLAAVIGTVIVIITAGSLSWPRLRGRSAGVWARVPPDTDLRADGQLDVCRGAPPLPLCCVRKGWLRGVPREGRPALLLHRAPRLRPTHA